MVIHVWDRLIHRLFLLDVRNARVPLPGPHSGVSAGIILTAKAFAFFLKEVALFVIICKYKQRYLISKCSTQLTISITLSLLDICVRICLLVDSKDSIY